MATWKHRLTEVDQDNKTGVCTQCGPVPLYYRKDRKQWKCAIAKEEQRGEERGAHGLTKREADLRKTQRGGTCELCNTTVRVFIDHDHVTGKLRGILCGTCNTGIGMLKDDPNLIRLAANYIEYWGGLNK